MNTPRARWCSTLSVVLALTLAPASLLGEPGFGTMRKRKVDVQIATGEDHLNRAADFMGKRLWSRAPMNWGRPSHSRRWKTNPIVNTTWAWCMRPQEYASAQLPRWTILADRRGGLPAQMVD